MPLTSHILIHVIWYETTIFLLMQLSIILFMKIDRAENFELCLSFYTVQIVITLKHVKHFQTLFTSSKKEAKVRCHLWWVYSRSWQIFLYDLCRYSSAIKGNESKDIKTAINYLASTCKVNTNLNLLRYHTLPLLWTSRTNTWYYLGSFLGWRRTFSFSFSTLSSIFVSKIEQYKVWGKS